MPELATLLAQLNMLFCLQRHLTYWFPLNSTSNSLIKFRQSLMQTEEHSNVLTTLMEGCVFRLHTTVISTTLCCLQSCLILRESRLLFLHKVILSLIYFLAQDVALLSIRQSRTSSLFWEQPFLEIIMWVSTTKIIKFRLRRMQLFL